MTDPTPRPKPAPTGLDASDVLATLSTALEHSARTGTDVSEACQELDSLHAEADAQALDSSTLLPEISAVTRRLAALSGADSIDRWEIDETIEQAAEVLRVMRVESLRQRLETHPQAALEFVTEMLATASERDIERILGAAAGELAVWRRDGIPDARVERVRISSQLLLDLRRAMSPEDMMVWFSAHRAHLDGRTPLELLGEDPGRHRERLRRLARAPHSIQAA